MVNEDFHVIQNDPLIIVDKFPYTKREKCINQPKGIKTEYTNKNKTVDRIYFLTHFHSDHYGNINKNFKENVFTSITTKKLLTNIIGVDNKYVHDLQINKKYYIFNIEIVLIDANHCPGAVIIYMEFCNGIKIIHTGDFRYTNVQIFLIKKILCFQNNKKKKENVEQFEKVEEINKLEILETNKFNNKNVDDGSSSLKPFRGCEQSTVNKEYVLFKNKEFDICQMKENFSIYESSRFIVNIEEFRLAYLHTIEKIISDLKYKTKEFYVYDNIESNNIFHYFIFIELSLYFNQNEQEILLLIKNEKLNQKNVVLSEDNVKDIRFLLKSCENVKPDNCCVLQRRNLQKIWDKGEGTNIEEEEKNDFLSIEKGNMNNICSNCLNEKNKNDIKKDEIIKKGGRNIESCDNIQNEKKMNNSLVKKKGRNEKRKGNMNPDEEMMENYITTIYLDTTYILSNNNLFVPQIYLINYIVYICKQKIESDLNYKCVSQEIGGIVPKKTPKIERAVVCGIEKSYEEIYKKIEKDENFKEFKNENLFRKKRRTLFLFGTYNIGKEKMYLTLAEACNLKIFFKNPKKKKIIETFLNDSYILKKITDNKLEAQIHIVDINYSYIFPKLEKNKFRSLLDEEVEKEFTSFYYIIPTGWTKKYYHNEKDDMTIILLPYSEHSNRAEIIDFVKLIKPCEIIPTVFDDEKNKTKILKILNPYLNLKMVAYNLFKPKNFVKTKKDIISKSTAKKGQVKNERKKGGKEIIKHRIYKTKAEKIVCDKSQTKLPSFITFLRKTVVKKELIDG